jgi:hypothetical protein
MKSVKRIFAVPILLMCAALLAIASAYLLVDDATLVSQMVKQLESSSDIRVLHRGDAHITRTLTPTLTVDDLVITDVGRQYRVETASLEVQVSLLKLLLGRLDIPYVIIGNTRIEIKKEVSPQKPVATPEQKPDRKHTPLPLKPALHDIRISQVKIIHEGGAVLLPDSHVSEFTMALNADNALELGAQVAFDDQQIGVHAVLKDVDDYFGGKPLTFLLGLQNTLCNLSVEGHIDFGQPEPTIKAAARAWTLDGAKMVTGPKGMEIPGKVTGEAQLDGTFSQLALEQITATWDGPDQSSVNLKGRMANGIKLEGLQLNLTGKLDNPAWLTPLLPENMGALKSANISAGITGTYPRISLKKFHFQGKTVAGLDLTLSGPFDLAHSSTGLEPLNIRAEMTFSAPKTRAARVLFFEKIPEFGAITGRCDIRSTAGDPALENITVQIKDTSGIEASQTGRIDKFPLANRPNSGYYLDTVIKATETLIMAERVKTKLPVPGPMDLTFRIEGDSQALKLNQITFTAGRHDGVQVGAQGHLWFGPWDQADPFETIDLKLEAHANTTALGQLMEQQLPELGPLSAQAHFHTVSGQHRLDELFIQTSKDAPLSASVSGSVKHVITLLPTLRFNDINLDANVGTDDTAQLNTVFGLNQKIPSVGSFKAQARISGDEQNLVIDDISVVAGHEDLLLVSLTGQLGKLSASKQWQPDNTNLSIKASSTSSQVFAEKMGYHIPELGPLSAQATIFRKDKKFAMDSAQLQLGEMDKPVVKVEGYIHDMTAMKGVKWDAQLDLDGRRFAAFADFHKLPDLGAVTGQASVSDSDSTLGLDSLHIETGQPDLLSLKVDGRFTNFKDPSTLLLNANLTARDLQLIGALFDRDWPAIGPVTLNTVIKRTDDSNDLTSTLTAGGTEMDINLKTHLRETPIQIKGTVTARKLIAWILPEKAREKKKKEPSAKKPVFSRDPIAFDWLRKVDMDIAIEVESFTEGSSLAQSAKCHVVVNSGLLSISPASLVYPKGKLDMELELDARDVPRLTFTAQGENLDPWRALNIEESKKDIAAEMDVDMSFNSSGLTPHELAANSQGSIYITIQNGKLRTVLTDLVFADIAGWAWHKTSGKRFVELDCGVSHYSIEKGIISTKALFLETKNISVTGQGTIDLGQEEIKYVLLPKKKTRLIHKADPVHIEGPLNDPSVKALPLKSAVTTYGIYGGMVLAPFIFVPLAAADQVAGRMISDSKESPCLEYQKAYKKEK